MGMSGSASFHKEKEVLLGFAAFGGFAGKGLSAGNAEAGENTRREIPATPG